MNDFKTRIDYSNNRQLKQFQLTNTILSGTTTFGVDDVYIPENATGYTVNLDALQYIQTRGLLLYNEPEFFSGGTATVLARDTDGRVISVPAGIGGAVDGINKQKEITDTYTITEDDNGYTIFLNKATAFTVTLDTKTTNNFEVDFYNIGVGTVTFVGGTATLGTPDGTTLATDKVAAIVRFMDTTTYKLKGELV